MRPDTYKNYYGDGTGRIPRTTRNRWNQRNLLQNENNRRNGDGGRGDENAEEVELMDCEIHHDHDDILSMLNSFPTPIPESMDSFFMDVDSDTDISDDEISAEADEEDKNLDWLSLKLFDKGELTLGDAVYYILDYFKSIALTKKGLDKLLQLLNKLLPKPNNLPKNLYRLKKLLFSLLPPGTSIVRKHQICEDCFHYLGEITDKKRKLVCDQCQKNNTNGIFLEYNLRQVLKDAFETKNLRQLLDKHRRNECHEEGIITDITTASQYRELKRNVIPGDYDLCLSWNTDGASVSHSSNGQIWPLQVQIVNIPPSNRRNFQFLTGIYYSRIKKPNMNSFLKPFSVIMKDLFDNGLEWLDKSTNIVQHSKVIAPVAPLDAPARAAAQNLMQYNGHFGCPSCEQEGRSCAAGHNWVFPPQENPPTMRTHEKMIEQARLAIENNVEFVQGVKGPSIAALIPCFDMAESFPPEYMHVTIGVVGMLMELWFNEKYHDRPFYISKQSQNEINAIILDISPPDYVARKPRILKYRSNFKASEKRDFLLFYFPVLLKKYLPKRFYENLLLVSHGLRIYLQSRIHINEISTAESMIDIFADEILDLYGLEKCSFNIHVMRHYAIFVKLWGPVYGWSTFPFEDSNGYFKKINHGPNKVDAEIVNTLKMLNAFEILKSMLMPDRFLEEEDEEDILGKLRIVELNENEIEAIRGSEITSHLIFEGNKLMVTSRARHNHETFTSKLYIRQKTRNNSIVYWNEQRNFGEASFFICINDCNYVLVRIFYRDLNVLQLIHPRVRIDICQTLIPVRQTYVYSLVPLDQLGGKMIYFNNYVCIPPNPYERKL